MSKPTIRIHDVQTNEVIDREMTDAEFEAFQAEKAVVAANNAAKAQAELDKAALLEKLGITADEAALLLS